jgi:hypothetical protein
MKRFIKGFLAISGACIVLTYSAALGAIPCMIRETQNIQKVTIVTSCVLLLGIVFIIISYTIKLSEEKKKSACRIISIISGWMLFCFSSFIIGCGGVIIGLPLLICSCFMIGKLF